MNDKRTMTKEMFITYTRVKKLLQSDEYKEFTKQFETTNERFYFDNAEKMFESVGINEEEAEAMFVKCYPVYDIFSEKFVVKSLNKYALVNFPTYSERNCNQIVEWLNEKLDERDVDDMIFENIL